MKPVLALLVLLTVVAQAGPALAEPPPREPRSFWVLWVGPELGLATLRDRGNGFVAGGSVSLVRDTEVGMFDGRWFGVIGDLAGDWNSDLDGASRWNLGLEAGFDLVMGSVAYAGERFAGETRHGVSVRADLTFIHVGGLYVRYSYFGGDDPHSLEIGATVTLPVWNSK